MSYVVNRNINYTNVCYFKCQFCAFSKGKASENLRGRPYDISGEEIARRCDEAWERGAVIGGTSAGLAVLGEFAFAAYNVNRQAVAAIINGETYFRHQGDADIVFNNESSSPWCRK